MHPYNFEKIKLKIYYILSLDNNINHFYKIINDNYIPILFISKICALFIILSTILGKYQNEIQIKETEKVEEIQNHNLNNNLNKNSIENKDRYLFFKNRYVNCSSIQEIKIEENTILITASKKSYCLKYSDENRALDNYNKLISFITDEVLELIDDDKE